MRILKRSTMLYRDTIVSVFLRYISKQLLNHLKRNLMYVPSFPDSLSSTHAYTRIECVEINLSSISEIFGITSLQITRKYAVISAPVKYCIPLSSLYTQRGSSGSVLPKCSALVTILKPNSTGHNFLYISANQAKLITCPFIRLFCTSYSVPSFLMRSR